MKRHVASLALLGLLAACGTNPVQAPALGTLASQTPQILSGTVKDVSFSAYASRLNDRKWNYKDETSWLSSGERYDAPKYPMKATYTLSSTSQLTKLRLYVGNGEATGTELIIRDGAGKELKRVARGKWDSWQEVPLSATTNAVTLEFSKPIKRFNISELEVYGVPAVTPAPPSSGRTYFDILGMNFTWASDTLIGKTQSNKIAKNVRFFISETKDFADDKTKNPSNTKFSPCTHPENIWACPAVSPRQNFDRIIRLSKEFSGLIFVAPEDPVGRSWPGKSWTAAELGGLGKAEQSGFNYADAYFKTFESLDTKTQARIVFAMTNEEWLLKDADGADRKAAYDLYRLGFVRAHKDHVKRGGKVQIATGARQMTNRPNYAGGLTESIKDLSSSVLAYINSVGGYTSIHIHDRPKATNPAADSIYEGNVTTSYGIKQLRDMRAWLNANGYANIKIYVGELSFTVSPENKLPTPAQLPEDARVLEAFAREAAKTANPVILYQVDDHSGPEGKFTGTSYGVRLAPWLLEFAEESK